MTRDALIKMAASPVEVAARQFVSVAIEAHRVNPNLHAVLSEQIPRVGRLENIEANVRQGYALVRDISRHIEMRSMLPISISPPSSA